MVLGDLGLANLITLFGIPSVYVVMDRLCVRLTGHGSPHGLRRAAEIGPEVGVWDRAAAPV